MGWGRGEPVPPWRTPTNAIAEGRALAAQLLTQSPAANLEARGWLSIRSADGQTTSVPLRLETVVEPSGWWTQYETAATNGIPGARLRVVHPAGKPVQFFLARSNTAGDSWEAPIAVPAENTAVPFAGSDFWLCDLAYPAVAYLRWSDQCLGRNVTRMGRPCRILESRQSEVLPGGYARVISYIDIESGGVLRAEAYDDAHELLKEFNIRSLKKVQGQWQVQEMEMRNLRTRSRTRLEFDYDR